MNKEELDAAFRARLDDLVREQRLTLASLPVTDNLHRDLEDLSELATLFSTQAQDLVDEYIDALWDLHEAES